MKREFVMRLFHLSPILHVLSVSHSYYSIKEGEKMKSKREFQREFDKIAASRMRIQNGGFPLHLALGQPESIRFRHKMNIMGVKSPDLIKLIDEISYQKTMLQQSLGVRYASIERPQAKRKVWGSDLF